jgi:anti-anti-sigma regulatory factor
MLATERDDSALLPGMFRLAVSGPDEPQPALLPVNGPFALIGREEGCVCQLNHLDVSRRHAYLQAIYGRIFCIDLGSRTGTHWGATSRKSGWLGPDSPVRIGPYQLQVIDSIGLGSPSAPFPENFSPLDPYAGQFGPLPHVELEILNGSVASAEMTVTRLITLVGSSPRCKLRLQHPSVAKVDCSLLWLVDGLWVVDLSGRGHSRVRGKPLRCARLENDQTLRLGRFHLRVHYSSGTTAIARPDEASGSVKIPASSWTTADDVPAEELPAEEELQIGPDPTVADDEQTPPAHAHSVSSAQDQKTTQDRKTIDEERAALLQERRNCTARRHAADTRERELNVRELKLSEAQGRLASEWEHLHVDRAAYDALAADLARKQEDLVARLRRLADDTESLDRQRIELTNRSAELADFRKRLTLEWQRLAAERAMGFSAGSEGSDPMTTGRTYDSVPNRVANSLPSEAITEDGDRDVALDNEPLTLAESSGSKPTVDFDVLETVRHNKVFSADRTGTTLVVTPLGDASEFHYGDVHVESNKVRRLLEGGAFENLLVDLGNTPVYSAVTINVVVALSRIASNRGGRAVLCRASEKTRGLLQTMKLLDVWPLFENREDALDALTRPAET